MNLESIMPNGGAQSQESTYCIIPFIQNVLWNKFHETRDRLQISRDLRKPEFPLKVAKICSKSVDGGTTLCTDEQALNGTRPKDEFDDT